MTRVSLLAYDNGRDNQYCAHRAEGRSRLIMASPGPRSAGIAAPVGVAGCMSTSGPAAAMPLITTHATAAATPMARQGHRAIRTLTTATTSGTARGVM